MTVAGEPDPETGFIIDLGKLKAIIKQKVLDPCDHHNLNLDVEFLKGIIPTTENLARAFFEQLRPGVEQACTNGGKLYMVKLFETERNIAEYCPYRGI